MTSQALPSYQAILEPLTIIDSFLSSEQRDEGCYSLDKTLGAMVAHISSPGGCSDLDLVELVFNGEDAATALWVTDEALNVAWSQVLTGLRTLMEDEALALANDYPIPAEATEPPERMQQWCEGYLHRFQLSEPDWRSVVEELGEAKIAEEVQSALSVIATYADWQLALESAEEPEVLQSNLHDVQKAVEHAVHMLFTLGSTVQRFENYEPHEPFIRETVKVGRNDPCVCGSGKKYKKCCGR